MKARFAILEDRSDGRGANFMRRCEPDPVIGETATGYWRELSEEEILLCEAKDSEIASLRSQLAASAEREWRDIKTAPKDGTQIVAIGQLRTAPGRTRACITHWCKAGDAPLYFGEGWTYCAPGFVDRFDPTLWQPLPAPPTPGEQQ